MYLRRVSLKNVRCFKDVVIEFDKPANNEAPLTVIVGDNATGKTTLLKAIAMGLCDESSAASLMKESDAGYIRKDERKARIAVDLCTKGGTPNYRVTTTIKKTLSGEQRLRQTKYRLGKNTRPIKSFPWDRLFVAGYGAGRGTAGTGDIVEYSVLNAVYSLFNYSEGLQNPELSLLRIRNPKSRALVMRALRDFTKTDKIELMGRGIVVAGIWGRDMPLRDLADGYKASLMWLTDFLGWAIGKFPSASNSRDLSGIVLIDEIEQHLHPKWQETVLDRLCQIFPRVQFILTTHSPLVAAKAGKIGGDGGRSLIHLELKEGNVVTAKDVPSLRGSRADQVLASEAFDYVITSDREIEDVLREASRLSTKGQKRTQKEERLYRKLKKEIAEKVILAEPETQVEREIEAELDRRLARRLRKVQHKIWDQGHDSNKAK